MVAPEDEADKSKQEQLPINFGKKLAHTDKKVRDKGFKNLRNWLRKHTELERLDYLKLWRGLYFGMWMSDKRPVQQDLAVQMALLINDIPKAKQGMWLDTFWETMQASWEKLDKHRLSKYLLFIRIVVAEAFKVVRIGGWQSPEVKALSETFLREVPRHAKQGLNTPSIGLNLQFHRILWDELRPQLKQAPVASAETIIELLEPFCVVAEGSALGSLVRNIHQHILLRVPPQYAGKLIFRLLNGAARKDISKANREALYETVDKLEKRPQVAADDPGEGETAVAPVAAKALPKKSKKKRRRPNKKKGAAPSSEAGGAAPAAAADEAEAEESPKAKKRREGSAAGDATPSADAAAAQEQVSPLRLPKAAIPARRRPAAAGAAEEPSAEAAEPEELALPPAKGKRKRAGAGPSGGSPKVEAAAAPGDAARKGPPR